MQSEEVKNKIIEFLCSSALSDHMGDVRDAERTLWGILGVAPLPYDDPAWDSDSAYTITKARLRAAGLDVPEYLREEDEDAD